MGLYKTAIIDISNVLKDVYIAGEKTCYILEISSFNDLPSIPEYQTPTITIEMSESEKIQAIYNVDKIAPGAKIDLFLSNSQQEYLLASFLAFNIRPGYKIDVLPKISNDMGTFVLSPGWKLRAKLSSWNNANLTTDDKVNLYMQVYEELGS